MRNECHIVADIGGTNARFAYVGKDKQSVAGVQVLQCAEYAHVSEAFFEYFKKEDFDKVDSVCMAVATVVDTNDINLTNNHWSFKKDELAATLNVPVKVINDWTAQALSLPYIDEKKIIPIGKQKTVTQEGVKGFLGPGTGLGVAALLPTGEVVPSEGGHISFAPVNQHEVDILACLWRRYSRVSVERILSGMGLSNLYWANAQLKGLERELSAKDVVAGAETGDEMCKLAVNDFIAVLGSTSGDVALMMGANSIYICGGIVPKMHSMLNEKMFRQRFEDKGRFSHRCSEIPVSLVVEKHSGLLGCISQFDDNE